MNRLDNKYYEVEGMNKAQRIVVLTGITIIALFCLFPPWKATFSKHHFGTRFNQITEPAGYGLIFWPPKPGRQVKPVNLLRIRLDLSRLVVQCAFVFVVAGGAFIYLSDRGEPKPPQSIATNPRTNEPPNATPAARYVSKLSKSKGLPPE